MLEQYYSNQQKGNGEFPVYMGAANQRGHGIGNIIGSIFRRILPELKLLAPHALRAGAHMFDDVSKGKSWKDSARNRLPDGLINYALGEQNQSGSGFGRRRTSKRKRHSKTSNKQPKKKRKTAKRSFKRDIFS